MQKDLQNFPLSALLGFQTWRLKPYSGLDGFNALVNFRFCAPKTIFGLHREKVESLGSYSY